MIFHVLLVGGLKPSEKYEFVNWDDNRNPILMGKCKIDGNQTTNQGKKWIEAFLELLRKELPILWEIMGKKGRSWEA